MVEKTGEYSAPGRFSPKERAVASWLCDETVEHLKEGVYNRLTKGIGGFRNLVVGHVAGGKGEIAALISDDRAGSLNRPLREIGPALDSH